MMFVRVLQLLMLALFGPALFFRGVSSSHLMIVPQSPVLQIGTNFTATCIISNTTDVTADDLYWTLSKTTVPKEHYTKINRSALSVTIPVTDENSEWLFCYSDAVSPYVSLNKGKFTHGICLTKGYAPAKPENLSCIAHQDKTFISPTLRCKWDTAGRQTADVCTTNTLNVKVKGDKQYSVETSANHSEVFMSTYPNHMTLEIWVESHNKLGKVESDHLDADADWFAQTNPPSDVMVISEKNFTTSLLINWSHPIVEVYMRLIYEIRFCSDGSPNWIYVPLVDTAKYIQSFRLQNLHPDTVYVTQVRCKNAKDGQYWSEWSANATQRTPEDRPKSKPDVWRISGEVGRTNERQVQFVCKDPVSSNGRITGFDVKILLKNHESPNWTSIPVNRSETDSGSSQGKITLLTQIQLPVDASVKMYVTANNSVGTSPEASLFIHEKTNEPSPVEELKASPSEGQLGLKWRSNNRSVSEYVVEWVSGDQTDWQRENRSTRQTVIKGNLEKFVCYTVSVYPLYSGWIGKPATIKAFLEQGAPLEGPVVVDGKPGRNEAELIWREIPQHRRRGFITNYTISYTSGSDIHNVTVPANITSYTLRSLSSNTKYDIWITASTIRGSTRGSNHSFTTQRYAPGEIEGIVIGVSLGFLFIVLMMVLFCIYKDDVIKENCWPWIPNPGESTIGNWSPDYPLKAETPENSLSDISVLNVCDGKCVLEDDKANLPLKRDYLSEEHSSGIGGSSCLSSPRQSVSDSDEGGDIADTTASTVQYSSVLASSGYKCQTPNSQPQQVIFSRSESTQPLLDSEENSDMLLQDGSKHSQCFSQQHGFPLAARKGENSRLELDGQGVLEPLDFGPLEGISEQMMPTDNQSADWLPSGPVSNYMPQLGGYRPQ